MLKALFHFLQTAFSLLVHGDASLSPSKLSTRNKFAIFLDNKKFVDSAIARSSPIPPQTQGRIRYEQLLDAIKGVSSEIELMEVVAKRIVYLEDLIAGGTEPSTIFVTTARMFLSSHGLKIIGRLHDSRTGFNAFMFRSKENQDWLIFTGANDALDWLDSFQLENESGRNQFNANADEILNQLILSEQETGKKAVVAGHSLGGAIAQIVGAEFFDHIKQVVTFNSASIEVATAQKFAHKCDYSIEYATHYYHALDPIPFLKGDAILLGTLQCFVEENIDYTFDLAYCHNKILNAKRPILAIGPSKTLVRYATNGLPQEGQEEAHQPSGGD